MIHIIYYSYDIGSIDFIVAINITYSNDVAKLAPSIFFTIFRYRAKWDVKCGISNKRITKDSRCKTHLLCPTIEIPQFPT